MSHSNDDAEIEGQSDAQTIRLPSLVEALQQEISLLQQLHILSQTEHLALESQHYEELEEIVAKKERIVNDISHRLKSIAPLLEEMKGPGRREISQEDRQALGSLKNEGIKLLELIRNVDSENRLRLEDFKSQAIQSSCRLQQVLKLHQAYDSPRGLSSQFSRLAD